MSAQPQPKSPAQVRRIFGLARSRGLDAQELRAVVVEVTKRDVPLDKTGVGSLNFTESDAVIVRLGGEPLAKRRTIQHRRAKAGVSQLVRPAQLELIAKLASQRRWGAEALRNFCARQCGHFPLRTSKDANKVIEALKAMNEREGLWAS